MSILIKNAFPLSGVSQAVIDGTVHKLRLPGTLDENNIGEETVREETEAAAGIFSKNRYFRKYHYEGPVRISRLLTFIEEPGKRYFLEA